MEKLIQLISSHIYNQVEIHQLSVLQHNSTFFFVEMVSNYGVIDT